MYFLTRHSRPIGVTAFVLAVVALAFALLRGTRDDYVVRARFVDAGQLVKGGAVQVGGLTVGSIPDIRLTDDGLAEVVLRIDDRRFVPLHRGTVATIRQVGLSGIANRFVDLRPGARSAREIPDEGVLSTADTRPIVDLDQLLNTLDPPTRARLQGILRSGGRIFEGPPSPRDANRAFEYLNPALSQARALTEEALLDQAALERLLPTTATIMTVLAGRRSDLGEGITNTAITLNALARERVALQDTLERAPGLIRRTRHTLSGVRETLPVVRPALRELQPAAKPLARTLRTLPPTVQEVTPVVGDTIDLVPLLVRALAQAPGLERDGLPTIRSLTRTLEDLLPIVIGLRPYTQDIVVGLLVGFGGTASGYYDANGPIVRVMPNIDPTSIADGLFALLFPGLDPGELGGLRTGLTARCPGGAAEPAIDKSNPWRPPEARCDPDQDHRG